MANSILTSNVSFDSNSILKNQVQSINSNEQTSEEKEMCIEDLSDCESSIGSLTMTQTYGFYNPSTKSNSIDNNVSTKSTSDSSMFLDQYKTEYDQLYNSLIKLTQSFLNLFNNAQNEFINIESLLPKTVLTSFQKYNSALSCNTNSSVSEIDNSYNFHFKLWKKHYCMLLDAFDVVFKDLQAMRKHNSDDNKNNKIDIKNLINDIQTNFGNSIIRFNQSKFDNQQSNSLNISCAFLIDLINQCRIFRGELERQNAIKNRLFYILKTAKDQRSKLKMYVSNLRNDLNILLDKMKNANDLKTNLDLSKNSQIKLKKPIGYREITACEKENYENKIQDLERILKEEELRRKKLHNRLQELIGNIRVYCRIRPHEKSFLKVTGDDKLFVMADLLSEKITNKWYGQKSKCFIFDRVFKPESSQLEVFSCVEELITSCVDGYNVCIMAYGQTGSGKTHTMMGTVDKPGVNRRAVQKILDICSTRGAQWHYRLYVSMVEVYQEEVRDLLNETYIFNPSTTNTVKIMSGPDDEVNLQGLTEHEVNSTQDVLRLFSIGERNRTVGATLLNETSSRSHLAVFLRVSGQNCVLGGAKSAGTLTLCDLAGAESASKSGATGERLCEASKINRSLTALGRVFDALRRRQRPSYRESKLTYLLKPTLGGDAKCLLIVNLRGEPEHAEETLRTIHFGTGAMQVAPEKAQYRSKVRKTLGKLD